jgi:hypothetical protein
MGFNAQIVTFEVLKMSFVRHLEAGCAFMSASNLAPGHSHAMQQA